MPQLDPTWFVSQLFWLCVSFFTMLAVMAKFFIPRIAEILAQRQHKIDSYLVKAHETKEKAEEALKKYQDALAQANLEADEALENTRQELREFIETRQNELQKSLNKKIAEGEKKIAQSKEEALKQVQEMSEELALDVVKKIGLNGIDAKDIKNILKKIAND